MLGKVEMCVLTVLNSKHDMGTIWEMMRSHHRGLLRVKAASAYVDQHGKQQLAGSSFS
jgi:hypothetical protein